MHKPIILFFLMLTHFAFLTASVQQPAQTTRVCRRAECAAGLCMAAIGGSIVFGMLIAGWADQSSSSSYHNVTIESVAPHSLAAHASVLALRSKGDLEAIQHAFKRQQAKPTALATQSKKNFTRHNFQNLRKRLSLKNNKQKKR